MYNFFISVNELPLADFYKSSQFLGFSITFVQNNKKWNLKISPICY
jgi:hypothetical protein